MDAGRVRVIRLVRMKLRMNSFQARRKAEMAAAARPGLIRGHTILEHNLDGSQPSMASASSSSIGNWSMKPYSSQMVKGRFRATYTSTTPDSVSPIPQANQITNTGTARRGGGSVRRINVE